VASAGFVLCLGLVVGLGLRVFHGGVPLGQGTAELAARSTRGTDADLASVLGLLTGSADYAFHVAIPAAFNKGLTATTATAESLLFIGGAQLQGLKIIDTVTETSLERALDLTGDAVSPAGGGLSNIVVNSIKGVVFGEIEPESGFVLMGNGDEWQSMSTEAITAVGTLSTGTWEADPIQPGFLAGVWLTNGVTYVFPTAQSTIPNQALVNDGTGTLSWSDLGLVNVADDILDFDKFKDAMTLDAATNIATAGYNLTVSGAGKFGINGLLYTWPAAHTASGVLTNDGAGGLLWTAIGADALQDDSIDWVKLRDDMTLDDTTTIDMATNAADFNFGAGTFFISHLGTVGVGSTSPAPYLFAVGAANQFGVTSGGALTATSFNGNTITQSTGTLTLGAGKTVSFADDFSTSGAFPITLAATASTNVTLPTTGTLLTTTASANQTITSTQLNGSIFGLASTQTINSDLTGATITLSGDGTNARTGLQLAVTGVSSTNYDVRGTADAWQVYSSGRAYFAGPLAVGTTAVPSFTIQSAGHVGPDADSLYNLGSDTVRWANVYADNLYGTVTPAGFVQGGVVFGGAAGALTQNVNQFYINTSTGNVGIGTSAPGAALGVAGTVAVGADYAAVASVNAAQGMIVQGNVGIGTTSPNYALETAGDIYAGGVLRSAGDVYLAGTPLAANATATSGATKVGVYADAMTYVTSDTNVQLALQTLDTQLASIASGVNGIWSRNAGTGVINPATLTDDLAIGGSTSAAPFYVSDTGVVSFASDTSLYRSGVGVLQTDTRLLAGNIGIGTTNPGTYLLAVGAANQFGVTAAGEVTAASINGNAIVTSSGSLTFAGGKVLTVNDTTTFDTAAITLGNTKVLTLNDSLTVGANSLTFGGGESVTFTAAKNVTFADEFNTSGLFPITLTASQSTNVTLPATGTLLTTTATANQTITSTQDSGTVFGLVDTTAITGNIIGQAITLSGTGAYDQTGLQFNLTNATGANLNDIVGSNATWKVSAAGTGYLAKAALGYATPGTATLAVSGNVGIGTTAPGYSLDVQTAGTNDGYINAQGGLCIDGVCRTSWTSGTQGYWTEYGDSIANSNVGNVGIGTTAPLQKLAVAGSFGFLEGGASPQFYTIFQGGNQGADITYTWPTAAAVGDDYVLTATTTGTLQWKEITGVGGAGDITAVGNVISGDAFTAATPGTALYFVDQGYLGLGAAAGRIVFGDTTPDGIYMLAANVGIGTTNPTQTLTVAGSGSFTGALTAASFNGNTITTGTGTLTLAAGKTVQFADAFFTSGAHSLTLTTTVDTNVTLPATGTLLTNTALANQTITSTQSSGTVFGLADITNLTGAVEGMDITLSGTGTYDQTGLQFNLSGASGTNLNDVIGSGSTWKVSTAGTGYFTKAAIGYPGVGTATLAVNGNVGIGTTAPSQLLNLYQDLAGQIGIRIENPHITTNGGVRLELSRGHTSRPAYLKYQTGTTDEWYVGELYDAGNANTAYSIATGYNLADSKVVVQAGGNVGIGTTNPLAMLTVGASNQFMVNSTGAIAAATGISSSGTIVFSGANTATTGAVYSLLGTIYSEAALDETRGGTGLSSYATGDMLYASGVNTLANLTVGTTGTVLLSNGTIPTWGQLSAAAITADSLDYTEFKNTLTLDSDTLTNFYNAGLTASYDMRFYDSDQTKEILYLDNVGRVGIGNTAPSVAFSVGAGEPFKVTDTGAVTAASINGNTITTGTGTLTMGAGKTLTVNATTTFGTSAGNDYIIFAGGERLTLASLQDVTFANAFSTTSTGPITLAAAGAGGSSVVVPTSGTLLTTTASANQTITSTQNSGAIFGLTGATNPAGALTAQAISLTGGATTYAQTGIDVTINGQGTTSGILKGLAFAISGGTSSMYDAYGTGGTWYTTNAGAAYFAGNVGIGTTSPSTKLHVTGTDSTTTIGQKSTALILEQLDASAAGVGSEIQFQGLGSSRAIKTFAAITGSLGGSSSIGSYGDIIFSTKQAQADTGLTERLTIKNTGNVGIGTTAPTAKLYVYDSAAGAAAASTGDNLVLEDDGLNYINFLSPTNQVAGLIFSDATRARGQITYNHANDSLRFVTASAQNMTIDSSGNVGIGTTNPTEKLTMAFDGKMGFAWSGADPNVYNSIYKSGAATRFDSFATTVATTEMFRFSGSASTGAADRPILSILNGGNVGIGTTAPGYKLDVQGGYVNASSGFCIAGSCQTSWTTGAQGYWTLYGTNIANNNAGNVGIGTTAPSQALEVVGNVFASGTRPFFKSQTTGSTTGSYFGQFGTDTTYLTEGVRYDGSTWNLDDVAVPGAVVDVSGTVPFRVRRASAGANPRTLAEFMRIDSVGNVGIGTTNPYSLFEISGGSTPALSINSTATNGNSALNFYEGNHASGIGLVYNGNPSIGFGQLDITDLGGSVVMAINRSGNVGIGTTAPAYKLDVSGTINTNSYVLAPLGIYTGGAANGMNSVLGGNTLSFRTNNADNRVVIDATGNVGIGTTLPAQQLSINYGTDFAIPALGADGGAFSIKTGGTRGLLAGNTTGGNFFMQIQRTDGSGTAYNMLLQPNGGNVGIGTTAPGAKLEVNNAGASILGISALSGASNKYTYMGIGRTAVEGIWGIAEAASRFTTDSAAGDIILRSSVSQSILFNTNGGGGPTTLAITGTATGIGNVGIGTTAPAVKLTVQNSASGALADALLLSNPSPASVNTGVALYLDPNGGSGTIPNTARAASIRSRQTTSGNHADLGFFTAPGNTPIERLTITSTGSVGIGTTAPARALSVNGTVQWGSTAFPGFNGYLTEASTSSGLRPAFTRNLIGSTGDTYTIADGAFDFYSGIQYGSEASPGNISFFAASAAVATNEVVTPVPRMTISVNGNVGIGATNPATRLEIYNATDAQLYLHRGATTAGAYSEVSFGVSTGNLYSAAIRGIRPSAADGSFGELGLYTSNDTTNYSSLTEQVRIDRYGNVGIGTTAPTAVLQIIDTAAGGIVNSLSLGNTGTSAGSSSAIYMGHPSTAIGLFGARILQIGTPTSLRSGDLSFQIHNETASNDDAAWISALFIQRTTGYVGVGVTNPLAALNVAKDIVWTPATSTPGQAFLSGASDATKKLVLGFDTTSLFGFIQATQPGTAFRNLVLQGGGGNVGIGTTAPASKVHIYESTASIGSAAGLTIEQGSTGDAMLQFLITSAQRWSLGVDNSDADKFMIGRGVSWATGADIVIDTTGNVGIGTTAPGIKLDVVGNARFSAVGSGATANDLRLTSDGTLTTDTSDISMKTNVLTLEEGTLGKLTQLHPVSFNWVADPDGMREIGFIAQEVDPLFPELTFTNPTDGKMGINYSRIPALLVKAMQEQQLQLDAVTGQVQELATVPADTQSQPSAALEALTGKLAELESANLAQAGRVSALQAQVNLVNSVLGLATGDLQPAESSQAATATGTTGTDLLTSLKTLYDNFVQLTEALGLGNVDGRLVVESPMDVLGDATFSDLALTGDLSAGMLKFSSTDNTLDIIGPACYNSATETFTDTVCDAQTLYVQKTLAGRVDFFNGGIVLEPNGDLTITGNLAVAGNLELAGNIQAGESMRGVVEVDAGQGSIRVAKPWEGDVPASVIATPKFAARVWVSDVDEEGFTVHMDEEAGSGEIYWIAVWQEATNKKSA
jgi:hypothetical protein